VLGWEHSCSCYREQRIRTGNCR